MVGLKWGKCELKKPFHTEGWMWMHIAEGATLPLVAGGCGRQEMSSGQTLPPAPGFPHMNLPMQHPSPDCPSMSLPLLGDCATLLLSKSRGSQVP